jgi:hypothetical protein
LESGRRVRVAERVAVGVVGVGVLDFVKVRGDVSEGLAGNGDENRR